MLADTGLAFATLANGVEVLVAAVAVGALTVAALGFLGAKSDAERAASQKTLEERLDELSKSMRDSARLVEQVSAELEARAASARRLTEEAKPQKPSLDCTKSRQRLFAG